MSHIGLAARKREGPSIGTLFLFLYCYYHITHTASLPQASSQLSDGYCFTSMEATPDTLQAGKGSPEIFLLNVQMFRVSSRNVCTLPVCILMEPDALTSTCLFINHNDGFTSNCRELW